MGTDTDDKRAQYLTVMQELINTFSSVIGEKAALTLARKAPIKLDADGNITEYYGEDTQAVALLLEQYEGYMGKTVARNLADEILADTDINLSHDTDDEDHHSSFGHLTALFRRFFMVQQPHMQTIFKQAV